MRFCCPLGVLRDSLAENCNTISRYLQDKYLERIQERVPKDKMKSVRQAQITDYMHTDQVFLEFLTFATYI